MRPVIVPTRGGLRLLRGTVLAAVSTVLGLVGHAGAGGGMADVGTLLVLGAVTTPLMTGLADRRARPAALVAILGAHQLVLHGLLQVLNSHPAGHAATEQPLAMVAMHAGATVLSAVLLAHSDQLIFLVAAALARVVPRRPRPLPVACSLELHAPHPAPAVVIRPCWSIEVVGRRGPPVPA